MIDDKARAMLVACAATRVSIPNAPNPTHNGATMMRYFQPRNTEWGIWLCDKHLGELVDSLTAITAAREGVS